MLLRNSLAHLIARVAALGGGIIAIPLVTMTLGTEALGLVGVYATLQAMLGLFDLGLPVAANNRLAVMIGRAQAPLQQAVMVRSLEILFWGMAALLLVLGLALHRPLAASWLNIVVLPRTTVETALALMIAAAAIRFPVTFYSNVLFAYDRHVYPNAIVAISALLRTAAAFIALIGFQVGIVGFFVIQLAGSFAEIVLLVAGVWFAQPHRWARPRLAALRDIASLAGGLTLISLSAVLLSQIDKVILSKVLTLGDFGIYSAGYALAAGLLALSYPIGNALFPDLSQGIDQRKFDAVARLVRAGTELTILLLIPLGAVLAMQPQPALDLLFLFRNFPPLLVELLPPIMLGGIAQGFVTLPHLFQIAALRSHTVLWINVAGLVPYAILVWVLANVWGAWGAALAFAIFNVARLLLHWTVLLMNPAFASSWRDVPRIVLGITALALGLAWVADFSSSAAVTKVVSSLATLVLIFVGAALALPITRHRILAKFPQSLHG